MLEQQFHTGPNGATVIPDWLAASAGVTYRYRLHAGQGEHIVPDSIVLNGRTIAATDKVRIATNDFLAGGSEGFTVFTEGTAVAEGPVDVDALNAYFAAHSPVASPAQIRIVRVD